MGKKWSVSSQSSYVTCIRSPPRQHAQQVPLRSILVPSPTRSCTLPTVLISLSKESTYPSLPFQAVPHIIRLNREDSCLVEWPRGPTPCRRTHVPLLRVVQPLPVRGNRFHAPISVHPVTPLPFVFREVDLYAALIVLFVSSRTFLSLLLLELVACPTHLSLSCRAPRG